jgi:hypothetical protein
MDIVGILAFIVISVLTIIYIIFCIYYWKLVYKYRKIDGLMDYIIGILISMVSLFMIYMDITILINVIK